MTRIWTITSALLMTCSYANAAYDCLAKADHAITTAANLSKSSNEILERDYKLLMQVDSELDSNYQNPNAVTVSLEDLSRLDVDFNTILHLGQGAWQENTNEVRDGCAKEDKIYDENTAKSLMKIQTGIAAVERVISYKR